MIKIIIADSQRIFRDCIQLALTEDSIYTIIGEASNGKELLEKMEHQQPDIVLADIDLPQFKSAQVLMETQKRWSKIKFIFLSSQSAEATIQQIIEEEGVYGVIGKNATLKELKDAIFSVEKGENWFSSDILKSLIKYQNRSNNPSNEKDLSNREIEIIQLICSELTNNEIAQKLNLSFETIKWHRANIKNKTQTKNIAGLVLFAIRNNLFAL